MRAFSLLAVLACGGAPASPCLWLVQDGWPTRDIATETGPVDSSIPVRAEDCLLRARPDGCVTPGFETAERFSCGTTSQLEQLAETDGLGLCGELLLRCAH